MTHSFPPIEHLSYDHLFPCACLTSLQEEIAALAVREGKSPQEIAVELMELGLAYLYEVRPQNAGAPQAPLHLHRSY